MEDLKPGPAWDPPALSQSTWEDVLNDLLQEPEVAAGGAAQVLTLEQELLGLVDGPFEDFTGVGEGVCSGEWWAAAPVDAGLDQIDLSDLGNTFIVEENINLPGLSSEVSSLAEGDLSFPDEPKTSSDTREKSQDVGVSSPGSCSRVEQDFAPSSNSGDEGGIASSRSHSPIVTSCSDQGAASPDAGCDSSDAGATGRSCDNFAEESDRRGDSKPGEIDEDAKRQGRLMRNRESATQSRLRKKSYIKELEAKCRAMESQMSMLHQTVAFTSAQNSALREELAHYRCLKGNGSKSGAMEPAALPSDSLPSESPSRRTTPFLSVKLELVAFLCHVLLLTLLQALPPKLATSGGKTPSEARSERRHTSVATRQVEGYSKAAKQLKRRQCSSNRRRKRIISTRDDNSLRPPKSLTFPAIMKSGCALPENSSFAKCKIWSKRSLKLSGSKGSLQRVSRRSQYSSLA